MSPGAQAFSLPSLALIQSAAHLPKPAITRDTASAGRTYEMEIPLKFNEAELKAIQHPRSAHSELSATFSASLTMENDGRICAAIDAKRRIDSTVTAADVKAIFDEMDVQIDEWAHGPLDFETLAATFNEDREPVPIPNIVRESLVSLKFDGDSAALVQQLDRNDYNRVNKILEALGGKWNKQAGHHVFASCDPEEAVANYLATRKLDKPEKFGFFPTPAPLARELETHAIAIPAKPQRKPASEQCSFAF